jgi:hypothetical protein
LNVPNASVEHQAKVFEPVGLVDGLELLGAGAGLDVEGTGFGVVGRGDGDVGCGDGMVGTGLGVLGRGDAEVRVGLGLGFGLCLYRCFGAGCRVRCFRADSICACAAAEDDTTAGCAPSEPGLPTRAAVPPPTEATRTAAATAGQNLCFVFALCFIDHDPYVQGRPGNTTGLVTRPNRTLAGPLLSG